MVRIDFENLLSQRLGYCATGNAIDHPRRGELGKVVRAQRGDVIENPFPKSFARVENLPTLPLWSKAR